MKVIEGRHALLTRTFSGFGVSLARPGILSAPSEGSDTGWKYRRVNDLLTEGARRNSGTVPRILPEFGYCPRIPSGGQERIGFSFPANGGFWTMPWIKRFLVSHGKHLPVDAFHERFIAAPGQVGATD